MHQNFYETFKIFFILLINLNLIDAIALVSLIIKFIREINEKKKTLMRKSSCKNCRFNMEKQKQKPLLKCITECFEGIRQRMS